MPANNHTNMKRTSLITLTLAIGLTLFQPVSAFAKEGAQKGDGNEKGKGKSEKAQAKSGEKTGNWEQTSQQPRSTSPSGRPEVIASRPGKFRPGNAPVAGSRASRATVTALHSTAAARGPVVTPSSLRHLQQPGYSGPGRNGSSFGNQHSYTRANNYGGLWVHGDTHRHWDRNRVHFYNNHRYGWYEGGWLIIDAGYRPRGYYFSDYSADSTVRQVQRRLTAEGYPVGYADGVIGPATRNGIANYQSDHRLAVTGRINDPLLASLGLE